MPGLLPFAVLAKSEDSAANLRQAALRIEQISDRRQQGTVAVSAYVLAGLLLEEALIQQILGQDIMQDSVTYQAIKQEGREEGRREASLSLTFRLLQHKFGQLADAVELRISQLPVATLESLGEAVLDFETTGDLSAWLEQPSGEE